MLVCPLCVAGFRAAEHPHSHEEADAAPLVPAQLIPAAPGQALEQTLPQTSSERTDPPADTCPHLTDYSG